MRDRKCGPGFRGRPPWWPENEPWPPRGTAADWKLRRRRFFRRMLALAVFLVILIVITTLAVARAIPAATMRSAAIIPILVFIPVLLATLIARQVKTLGDVMEAADRVASSDYSVRVKEHGPAGARRLARAFNTMTERLEHNDRMRRDLMADVAHELRTPLTVIQGRLEGLIDGVYPRDDRQLTELLDEARVLSRLIEDLRTIALSESGALRLQTESTDAAALARDAAGAMADEAARRDVRLAVEANGALPPVDMDPIRVREILTNLLTNALQHTSRGGSVVVQVASADGQLVFDVRDTGSGMTPEQIERAFDRFHKGPASRGTGLGLAIARSLVEAHGGRISASSTVDAGTTITFTLPTASN